MTGKSHKLFNVKYLNELHHPIQNLMIFTDLLIDWLADYNFMVEFPTNNYL